MRPTKVFFLFCALALSCAAPRPYYENATITQPLVGEEKRGALANMLSQVLGSSSMRRLDVEGPDGNFRVYPPGPGSPALETLPVAALWAAFAALDRSYRGAEWDMVVPTRDHGLVPVSVFREPDGSMRLVIGPTLLPPTPVTLTATELSARHGIGPLREGDARWGNLDLFFLDQALALLLPEERPVLAQIPFVRQHRPPQEEHGNTHITARYVWEGGDPRIEIFDSIKNGAAAGFCGDPRHPRPLGSFAVLHEVGHAVVHAPTVALSRHLDQAVAAYNAKVAHINSIPEITPEQQRLELELDAQGKALGMLEDRLAQEVKLPSVLAAYLLVRGPVAGPTPYGGTSANESFADSFALFHVDPAALQRVYPAVHRWFAAREHVKLMQQAGG